LGWLEKRRREVLDSLGAAAPRDQDILCDLALPIIQPVLPATLNDRMRAQEGLLLVNGRDGATFSQMLMRQMIHPTLITEPVLRRILIPQALRVDISEHLRAKNIHEGALFPGSDAVGNGSRFPGEWRRTELLENTRVGLNTGAYSRTLERDGRRCCSPPKAPRFGSDKRQRRPNTSQWIGFH